MPGIQDVSTTLQPNNGVDGSAQKVQTNPKEKQQIQQPIQSLSPEEIMQLIQQGMEQVKFEMRQENVQAINAKAQQLSDIDPSTSTSMRAIAGALNEAVSSVTPLGQNEEFNAQQNQQALAQQEASQQQVKQASDKELGEFVWNVMCDGLTEKGYFEKNASIENEIINKDLTDTFVKIGLGLEKFAEDNDVDFHDSNYQDLLAELILDGTLLEIGSQENE